MGCGCDGNGGNNNGNNNGNKKRSVKDVHIVKNMRKPTNYLEIQMEKKREDFIQETIIDETSSTSEDILEDKWFTEYKWEALDSTCGQEACQTQKTEVVKECTTIKNPYNKCKDPCNQQSNLEKLGVFEIEDSKENKTPTVQSFTIVKDARMVDCNEELKIEVEYFEGILPRGAFAYIPSHGYFEVQGVKCNQSNNTNIITLSSYCECGENSKQGTPISAGTTFILTGKPCGASLIDSEDNITYLCDSFRIPAYNTVTTIILSKNGVKTNMDADEGSAVKFNGYKFYVTRKIGTDSIEIKNSDLSNPVDLRIGEQGKCDAIPAYFITNKNICSSNETTNVNLLGCKNGESYLFKAPRAKMMPFSIGDGSFILKDFPDLPECVAISCCAILPETIAPATGSQMTVSLSEPTNLYLGLGDDAVGYLVNLDNDLFKIVSVPDASTLVLESTFFNSGLKTYSQNLTICPEDCCKQCSTPVVGDYGIVNVCHNNSAGVQALMPKIEINWTTSQTFYHDFLVKDSSDGDNFTISVTNSSNRCKKNIEVDFFLVAFHNNINDTEENFLDDTISRYYWRGFIDNVDSGIGQGFIFYKQGSLPSTPDNSWGVAAFGGQNIGNFHFTLNKESLAPGKTVTFSLREKFIYRKNNQTVVGNKATDQMCYTVAFNVRSYNT
jgi:hypothetical protein